MPLTDSNTYTPIGDPVGLLGLPEDRVEHLLASKDVEAARAWCGRYHYEEGWASIDGTVVVYNLNSPPAWLAYVLAHRDDNGDTPSGFMDMPERRPYDSLDDQA